MDNTGGYLLKMFNPTTTKPSIEVGGVPMMITRRSKTYIKKKKALLTSEKHKETNTIAVNL